MRRSGRGPRALAAMVSKITRKVLKQRGFAEAGIITDWPAIVGAEIALESAPEKLVYPPGERLGGVLHIRVAGALATELQHLEPLVIERINGYFGYRAVARLRLLQGPLPVEETAPPAAARRRLGPEAEAALREGLAEVPDDDLKAALERLGRAVMAKADRRDPK